MSPKPSTVDATLARDGGLSYLEIPAVDLSRSAAFYEAVLGWKIDRNDPARPKFMDRTGHLLGRWALDRTPARDSGLLPYFYVDQMDLALRRVADFGGKIDKPPYPEGNLTVSVVHDPAGNMMGLWQEGRE